MLRAALALLSTLQVGAHIKELCKRYLRQAVVIAVAAGLLIVAAVFGLLAAYHALVSIYQFSALQAAEIMAACLLLVGLMVLVIVPLIGRQAKRANPSPLVAGPRQGHPADWSRAPDRHRLRRRAAAGEPK